MSQSHYSRRSGAGIDFGVPNATQSHVSATEDRLANTSDEDITADRLQNEGSGGKGTIVKTMNLEVSYDEKSLEEGVTP
jgi:hypothetical protein